MQHGRAMAIEHAFGVARCARGVAKRAGRLLIELRPLKVGALVGHDLFVTEHVRAISLRHVFAGGHDHPALDTRALTSDALDQRPKVWVEEDVAVLGMVDDVNNLLGK